MDTEGQRKYVQRAMLDRGWNQTQLVGASGVNKNTVSGFLSGKTDRLTLGTLAKIERALGMTPGTLAGPGEDGPAATPATPDVDLDEILTVWVNAFATMRSAEDQWRRAKGLRSIQAARSDLLAQLGLGFAADTPDTDDAFTPRLATADPLDQPSSPGSDPLPEPDPHHRGRHPER